MTCPCSDMLPTVSLWAITARCWSPMLPFVTKTVEEDGIAYAMKELGII